MRENWNIVLIIIVSVLLILFAALYFSGTKKRKRLIASYESQISKSAGDANLRDIESEWAEQFTIISAQAELLEMITRAFVLCFDYSRDCFTVSTNGEEALGIDDTDLNNEAGDKILAEIIHPDDYELFDEVTGELIENHRSAVIADSPYVIRLRKLGTTEYKSYIMCEKVIYNELDENKALILAFIGAN